MVSVQLFVHPPAVLPELALVKAVRLSRRAPRHEPQVPDDRQARNDEQGGAQGGGQGGVVEQTVVSQASPTLTTNPSPKTVTLGTTPVTLTDSATLANGYNPLGTITFTLVGPGGGTVDTEIVTVTGNGIMQQCLYWPPTPPTPQPRPGAKILVPTLVLAGDRDLSTPLPWPRAELKLLPHGHLVFVHGMGHSTQRNPQAQAAVEAFLLRG